MTGERRRALQLVEDAGIGKSTRPRSKPVGEDVEPAEGSVEDRPEEAEEDGAAVLDVVYETLTRFVVFPSVEAGHAVTLYAAATYAVKHLQTAPRLYFKSPEKRCGKSRTLDILMLLIRKPLATVDISVAALVRSTGDDPPTFLIDETDAIFGGTRKGSEASEKSELLRGILNSGFDRGRFYIRWDVKTNRPEELPTFAMVILAGIRSLPDTIEDRSIIIPLRRKARDETVSRYRVRRHKHQVLAVGARLGRWVLPRAESIAEDEPELPDELNDRAQDAWEPLFAVAAAAGGHWPARAQAAAIKLSGEAEDGEAESRRLLADIRSVFERSRYPDQMQSTDLCDRLALIEEAPWGHYFGADITPNHLAALLRPYGIKPLDIPVKTMDGWTGRRGYKRADFEDSWARYLPQADASVANSTQDGPDESDDYDAAGQDANGGRRKGPMGSDESTRHRTHRTLRKKGPDSLTRDIGGIGDIGPDPRKGGHLNGLGQCARCGEPATRRAAGKPSCAGCARALMEVRSR